MKNLGTDMERTIKDWWILLIMGILFVISGISVFSTPLESYIFLSILFSVVILSDGIGNAVFAISNREVLKSWGLSFYHFPFNGA